MADLQHIHRRTGTNGSGIAGKSSSVVYIILFVLALCSICQSIDMIIYRLK